MEICEHKTYKVDGVYIDDHNETYVIVLTPKLNVFRWLKKHLYDIPKKKIMLSKVFKQ